MTILRSGIAFATSAASPEVAGMLWLFRRCDEYLYCEARTCLDDSGYEIVIESAGRVRREWFPDETQLTRRWDRLNRELRLEGWANSHRAES
jgi:hypothetical protein